MKKIYFIGILLFSILTMLFVYLNIGTQKYNSSYGFSSEVSKNWFIITKDSIENQKYIFDFMSKNVSELLTSYIKDVKKSVQSGYMEFLFYQDSDLDFQDRITILKIQDSKVNHEKRIRELCADLQVGVREHIKRDVNIYYCNLQNVHGIDTMTYSYGGEVEDTTNIRYFFNTKNASIALNIDCKNNKCTKVKQDAEQMIKNLKFD